MRSAGGRVFTNCDASVTCEDYNTYRAHPWSHFYEAGPSRTRSSHNECTSRVSFPSILRGNATKFAQHKALKVIACDKLTFDERVIFHRALRLGNVINRSRAKREQR